MKDAMRFAVKSPFCLVLALAGALFINAQETDRKPFAIEFPELNTGRIFEVQSKIGNANVNVIKFWVLNPAAESINWDKIKVRINNQSANRICSQLPASEGKVLRCDLKKFADVGLKPKENFLEIEVTGTAFYGSFRVATVEDVVTSKSGPSRALPTQLGFSGRRFAVVMGVSKYRYNDVGLGNLNYADKDAEALYGWLTTNGGFSPQDVLYLTNESATLSVVRDSVKRFLNKAAETDLVLFFFAGHGTPDPFDRSQLYYLVHDSKVGDLKGTALPMWELRQMISENLRSKRAIFLLDTCHSAGLSGKQVVSLKRSGSAVGERAVGDVDIDLRQLERVEVKNTVSEAAGQQFALPGRAVLTSSGAAEASQESKRWGGGHGVFTWALLEGLRGQADSNGDKSITASELFSFVRTHVRAETDARQNPQLFANIGNEIQITTLRP